MFPAAHGAKEIPSKIKVFAENTGEGFLCKIPPSPLLFKTPRKGRGEQEKKVQERKGGGRRVSRMVTRGEKKRKREKLFLEKGGLDLGRFPPSTTMPSSYAKEEGCRFLSSFVFLWPRAAGNLKPTRRTLRGEILGSGWWCRVVYSGRLFLLGIASVACPAAVHPKQREGEREREGVETSSPGDAETTGDAPGEGFARFRARFKRGSISILL